MRRTSSGSFGGHTPPPPGKSCACLAAILADGVGDETGPNLQRSMTDTGQLRSSISGETAATGPGVTAPVGLDPERWVEDYGDVLFGFAVARVRDQAIAQDLVQETFLAALKAARAFAGRASERAWLFGILRNKLADHYRRQGREISLTELESPWPEEEAAFHGAGPGKDGWVMKLAPKAWETPEESLMNREFHEVFRSCLSRLPPRVAQVFYMREVDGVTSENICKDLGVTPTNLWVMLHRARIGLRRCLEMHWFGKKPGDG